MKPQSEIGLMMKKISERIEKHVNQKVKKHSLTLTQARVIGYLVHKEFHSATQKELEDSFEVSHPTIVTILGSMQSKGLVECRFDAKDKRTKMVYLAWGDDALYEEIKAGVNAIETQLLRGFSEEESAQFENFLERAYKNMSE